VITITVIEPLGENHNTKVNTEKRREKRKRKEELEITKEKTESIEWQACHQ